MQKANFLVALYVDLIIERYYIFSKQYCLPNPLFLSSALPAMSLPCCTLPENLIIRINIGGGEERRSAEPLWRPRPNGQWRSKTPLAADVDRSQHPSQPFPQTQPPPSSEHYTQRLGWMIRRWFSTC